MGSCVRVFSIGASLCVGSVAGEYAGVVDGEWCLVMLLDGVALAKQPVGLETSVPH